MKIHPKIVGGIVAVALVALTAGCTGTSTGTTTSSSSAPVSINLGLVQGQDFVHALPARVAEAQGFFTKEGLATTVVAFTSGSDLTKAIAGGSIDAAAATGLDAVSATAHGVPIQAFYGVEGPSPMALIVGADSTISSFSDLKGKKVGISAFGSLTDFVLRAGLAKAKVAFADVKEVPLGAPSAQIAALAKGDIDGFILPVNFGYTLAAAGKGKIAVTGADAIGGDTQFAVLMASTSYIAANPGTLKKLAAAYTDALNWMKANKSATVKLAVEKLSMTDAIASQTYDALIGNFTPDGQMNAAGMAAYATALPELKIAQSAPAASEYMTTAIIK